MNPKKSPEQKRLFKKEILEMPEGYYSSGPNPNLEKFVAEHATPYDPATDDYNVPPFDKPIKTSKRTAIYNMHSYPSKKPHDAIREYIKHYSQPGELVLDPFCGSGGTGLAALMEGRKAIVIDLSPAATFITKNYCTPVDVDDLKRAFNKLEAEVKYEMDWLYETRCDQCDGRAMTNYVVWSYVFECPRCLKKVPIYECPEVDVPKKNGDGTKKAKVCPYCKKLGNLEQISSRTAKRFDPVPVLVNYKCIDGCEPNDIERKHNDNDPKKRQFFKQYDFSKISEIESSTIPYWYPTTKFPVNFSKWKTDLKSLGINSIDQMYSKRNLWAISLIRNAALRDSKYKDWLLFTLTGTLLALSRMQRYSPNSTFPNMLLPNTLYIAPLHKEYNALDWYIGKKRGVINGAEALKAINESLLISTDTATNLQIKNDSIDYIFTDPPYSDKVQYGELNFVLEAWLGFDLNWHDQEIIVNENRGLTEEYWAEMIKKSMAECYRVLKPGRCISLCYHDTSEGTWQLVQDIMAEVGFIVEKAKSTLFIDTREKSFNQINAQKVTKRDLVINFRKPRLGEIHSTITITGDEDERTFSQKARTILTEALERSPGSTADRLYDELVSRMVQKGEFERHNFDKLLRNVAEEVPTPDPSGNTISRWYLLETAGEVDSAESNKESSAAEQLEAFMVTYLKEHPEFEGVHYSDLFEQYLPVQDKPRRLLIDWLPEFFYRTSEGTWRPPKDNEERQQKEQLRTSGILRQARRFANALRNSVPPAEKDRPENAATLAAWINECRRAGLYELGKLLYEQGGHSFDALSEKEQLAVQENYQICARRSGDSTDQAGKSSHQDQQASLF